MDIKRQEVRVLGLTPGLAGLFSKAAQITWVLPMAPLNQIEEQATRAEVINLCTQR